MPEPLEIHALTKTFGHQVAVEDVSLIVPAGRVVGILGPNGSGKSTTLHCVTGFHSPTAGRILIDGHNHDAVDAKNAFGFFPDDLPVPESLTGDEVLAFHRRLRPDLDEEFVSRFMNVLGLDEHRDKMVGDYSHGMRRKLQLVLAVAHHPRLLVLDEPLRGLDPEAGALMQSVIDQFAENGGGVLVATHDLLAAEQYFSSVVVLAQGKIVAEGAPHHITRAAGATHLTDAFVTLTGIDHRVEEARTEVAHLLSVPRGTAVGT